MSYYEEQDEYAEADYDESRETADAEERYEEEDTYDSGPGYQQQQETYEDTRYTRGQQGYQQSYEEVDRYQQGGGGYQQQSQSREVYQEPYRQQGGGYQQQYQQAPQYGAGGQRGISGGSQYQDGGYQRSIQPGPQGSGTDLRRKSLLIGINYEGQNCALQGCREDVKNMSRFLASRGYPTDSGSMIVLTDDQGGRNYASGENILAAFDWLVSEPGYQCFLHYSGHGGQVQNPQDERGYEDTICPVDYQQKGQINSETLHQLLVSKLAPSNQLFVVFDCCHSGSALELPYVYRTDADGNVNLLDDLKQGMRLAGAAQHLLQGGFSMQKVGEAKQLYAGAHDFFQGLKHLGQQQQAGLGEDKYAKGAGEENKAVFMLSGCKDDQTSADATIGGSHVGAMSWALLKTLNSSPGLSYIQVLQHTRELLAGQYTQIPQLSIGLNVDLNQPLHI